jgi:uncharacterized membrane protein SpoIIM required for sporulation
MFFIIALILLTGMGLWVAYQLFLMMRRGNFKILQSERKPLLYWIIFIAQILFLIACSYRLYREIF